MDEHGLPIVGAGVDYTKVSWEIPMWTVCARFSCVYMLFVREGACSRAQEYTRLPQCLHHSDRSVSQPFLSSMWRGIIHSYRFDRAYMYVDLFTYMLWIHAWSLCLVLQRLGELSLRIQRLDISLNILEAKVRKSSCLVNQCYSIIVLAMFSALYCVWT